MDVVKIKFKIVHSNQMTTRFLIRIEISVDKILGTLAKKDIILDTDMIAMTN